MVAHAVDAQSAGLAGRGDHLAAGAHAEAVAASSVRRVDSEFVIRRTQGRMLPGLAVLALADEGLRMLNAHAHGEGLLHHHHALVEQALHGVAGAVANGQEDGVGQDLPLLALVNDLHAFHTIAADDQLRHPGFEQNRAAQTLDFLAHGSDDALELVRADMGLGQVQDLLRRAVLHEGLQNRADVGRLCAGSQLAVRERARAALAELHIAVRVEGAVLLHGGDILGAGFNGLASLDQDGVRARLGQRQRGEQACRARTHHHRRTGKLRLGQGGQHGRIHAICRARLEPLEDGVLVFDFHIHGDDEVHVPLVAGVHGLLRQRDALQHVCWDAQTAEYRLSQGGYVPGQGHREVVKSKHDITLYGFVECE